MILVYTNEINHFNKENTITTQIQARLNSEMKVIENLLVSSKQMNLKIIVFLLCSSQYKITDHLLGRSLSQKNLLPLLFLFSRFKKVNALLF